MDSIKNFDKNEEIVVQFKTKDLFDYGLLDLSETYQHEDNICDVFFQLKKISKDELNIKLYELYINNKLLFEKRINLENSNIYKHLISYFIIRNVVTKEVLIYKRNNPSESRLNQKQSIGWGGHTKEIDLHDNGNINIPITSKTNIQFNILKREFEEELKIVCDSQINISENVYVLYSGLEDVSKVHLGIVYFIDFPDSEFKSIMSNEIENEIIGIKSIDVLKSMTSTSISDDLNNPIDSYFNMEGWSQLIINICGHFSDDDCEDFETVTINKII